MKRMVEGPANYVVNVNNMKKRKFTGYKDKNGKRIYDGDVIIVNEDKEGCGVAGLIGSENGVFGDIVDGFSPLSELIKCKDGVRVLRGNEAKDARKYNLN